MEKNTAQVSADCVRYVNKEKQAGVRLWEVGNELYGDLHIDHTTGPEYGKLAAEFIKAMKAVDPSILISVVWVGSPSGTRWTSSRVPSRFLWSMDCS